MTLPGIIATTLFKRISESEGQGEKGSCLKNSKNDEPKKSSFYMLDSFGREIMLYLLCSRLGA